MDQLIEVVRALRNLRAESGIAPSVLLEAAIVPARRTDATSLSSASDLIVHLARLKAVRFMDAPPADGGTWAGSPVSTGEVFVETRGALDPAKERERLEREMASVAKDLEKSRAKLANADFVSRAPAAVVEKERANLEALETAAAKLRSRLGLPP
jgi:valyl-tRNA synthetase